MIRSITKLFKPLVIEGDDTPMKSTWAGSEGYAACFDPNKGRLYATLWNDSDRKFYPTIYASIFDLLRIRRCLPVVTVTFLGLPRCAIELHSIKCDGMNIAQSIMEDVLAVSRLIS
ncbi:hypothetical protein [Bradyrhizobium iriomotense]|uniref:Uncharacterized protein n=1 Tax=Bradyrhizobium iriomotense TaxID=441950 RepID=A0ABQ6B9Z2_9BRAD|nr:hypothetical protein [Bradyrhizobium iriomotense]GLR89755.1 hypothetical protein GCM10007857_64690 [Bradyrhizobium iriomotense]